MLESKLNFDKYYKKRLKKYSGRNNSGKITVYHRGGGLKKFYININQKLTKKEIVLFLKKNTNSNHPLLQTNTSKFAIAPENINVFDNLTELRKPLKTFEVGTFLHNIENLPQTKGSYARAAGTYCQLIQKETKIDKYSIIKLPSGENKYILNTVLASKGKVGFVSNAYTKLYKAGQNRWRSKRPHVRGVAMNPVDHPHGGGEGKTSSGRPSVSFTGKLTKNVKTRTLKPRNKWLILRKK